jgi:hypothetical protein
MWGVLHLTRCVKVELPVEEQCNSNNTTTMLSFLSYRCYKFQQLVHPVCTVAVAICLLATLICKGVCPLCHVNCAQLHITTGVCDKCAKCQ